MTPTSINPTDRKNPLRNTPWTGRLLLALTAALLSVTAAMVFKNVTVSEQLLGTALMVSVLATIASLILLGKIGKYNMLRRRVYAMTWSTYLLSVAGRLTAKFGSTSFMSCSLFSILWMVSMALLQVPNMVRAVEIRKAEDMVERETLWSNPSSFHRFSGEEPFDYTFYNRLR